MNEASGRLYQCHRCFCQVVICSHCDRGNIYCGTRCRGSARSERQKLAGQRYQSSSRGRQKHAARQARYRIRQIEKVEKVTHRSSPDLPLNDLLSLPPEGHAGTAILNIKKMDSCFFCNKHLHPALRIDFLNRDTCRITALGPAFPSGP